MSHLKAAEFRLAGVGLGFEFEQTVLALQEYFKISRGELAFAPATDDLLTGLSVIKAVEYSSQEETVFVGLEFTDLNTPKPRLVVAFVQYKGEKLNRDYLSVLVEKYGAPSEVLSAGEVYLWCDDLINGSCNRGGKSLGFNGAQLMLSDPRITGEYFCKLTALSNVDCHQLD